MQTIRQIGDLRDIVAGWRADGLRIALVPTMGALHAGHMALIDAARGHADRVVASIFVNPRQFGVNEDFGRYPRQEAADGALLTEHGCDLLWAPDVATMYPDGFATSISVTGVSEGLCGAARPGHFDGVATVVAKLFNQVTPDVALFGEKDFQQLAVIRRMARDLDMAVDIVGVLTIREAHGLALSSRNAYLDPAALEAARALPRVLAATAAAIAGGAAVAPALDDACRSLLAAGFAEVDYLELRAEDGLAPMARLDRPARLLAAARIGGTRLIDNIPISPPQK
jgi:pantoate--beta-alanine ligase